MFTNVLVAVDRSRHAQAALHEAADIARAQGASLTVMTVYSTLFPSLASMDMPINQEVYEQFRAARRAEAEAAIRDGVAALPEGMSAQTVTVEGHAATAILQQATDGGHDLIVVGSRGHGDAASILLGSVSHNVLHHSRVPVLIVHLLDIEA
ncbi:MAG: universal stress protein [Candidatus Dormibacteria bacterium]